ncbi:unnamed protein product [Lota lota]
MRSVVLHLARAQEPSEILSLREAAVAFPGELPCPSWSCDCAFRQLGCCCATGRMHEVEELTFSRLTGM